LKRPVQKDRPHERTGPYGIAAHGPTLLASLVIILMPALVSAQPCPGGRLLLLTNGKIHTMDAKRTVVSKVRIANGRFVEWVMPRTRRAVAPTRSICAAARSFPE
jgi:hypothetical protein